MGLFRGFPGAWFPSGEVQEEPESDSESSLNPVREEEGRALALTPSHVLLKTGTRRTWPSSGIGSDHRLEVSPSDGKRH